MITEKQMDRRESLRSLYDGLECLVCGDEAKEFHHRNPAEKEFSIANSYMKSEGAFRRELARCDPLCHRCHVDAHRELRLQRARRMKHTFVSWGRERGRDALPAP